jgi:hypothetical protein
MAMDVEECVRRMIGRMTRSMDVGGSHMMMEQCTMGTRRVARDMDGGK